MSAQEQRLTDEQAKRADRWAKEAPAIMLTDKERILAGRTLDILDERARLTAALDAATKRAEWRNMDSAPKDDAFLALCADGCMDVVYWDKNTRRWRGNNLRWFGEIDLVKWQPLPPPPAGGRDG